MWRKRGYRCFAKLMHKYGWWWFPFPFYTYVYIDNKTLLPVSFTLKEFLIPDDMIKWIETEINLPHRRNFIKLSNYVWEFHSPIQIVLKIRDSILIALKNKKRKAYATENNAPWICTERFSLCWHSYFKFLITNFQYNLCEVRNLYEVINM